ncbi:P-loop containing nucleoside triphosphate hydrolase protein [Westerdykella ornata]|uniref:P-loop containing nucleoside triphosphate hydrolase protein n=1 Tax=Westerdykella ornata TaxID=318751 RepID=A0A6A6JN83_WESOR|nr:P-loop containing nucleoside triphosphate hydrolase protein [Westerdykella ornata]KAF2277573.1 P-loop containing nucleoside triphosphate hydrolase protein [Westerdykella ornata]
MASWDIDGGDYRLRSLELSSRLRNDQPDLVLQRLNYPKPFSVKTLCAAIQKHCSVSAVKTYLSSYAHADDFKRTMASTGWPALYYAVERNSAELVAILLRYQVDPHWSSKTFPIPVIVFAIIHGHREALDTTDVVRTFLACGVDPKAIAMDMWEVYLDTPKPTLSTRSGPSTRSQLGSGSEYSWCTEGVRRMLAEAFHLTHRYHFHRAHRMKEPTMRIRQIAEGNKMSDLLKLPFFLVGQRSATKMVQTKVYPYIAGKRNGPLVMAFDGPSGHGKTELARIMGDLLSVKTQVIDCGKIRDQWGILGPTTGWRGHEKGSQLNNFLAENSGLRSVVFLDEFDKTDEKVMHALLVVIEKGEYEDRRHNTAVDCSKTIWIIATNVGAEQIVAYYTEHLSHLSEDEIAEANLADLQKQLGSIYQNEFGAPFTGRVGSIIPFLPFSKPEVAVVGHKFILRLASRFREPISLQPGIDRYAAHCRMTVLEDGMVCAELAQEFYNQHAGARSIENAVVWVEEQAIEQYGLLEMPIDEKLNEGPLQEIVVQRIPAGNDEYEIKVIARIPEEKSTARGGNAVPVMDDMHSTNGQTSEKKKENKGKNKAGDE